MNGTEDWLADYGPNDGRWLRDEFAHMTTGLRHIQNVRLARLDQQEAMQHYAALAKSGQGISGDWEVISPYTGQQYMMGCNWHD